MRRQGNRQSSILQDQYFFGGRQVSAVKTPVRPEACQQRESNAVPPSEYGWLRVQMRAWLRSAINLRQSVAIGIDGMGHQDADTQNKTRSYNTGKHKRS